MRRSFDRRQARKEAREAELKRRRIAYTAEAVLATTALYPEGTPFELPPESIAELVQAAEDSLVVDTAQTEAGESGPGTATHLVAQENPLGNAEHTKSGGHTGEVHNSHQQDDASAANTSSQPGSSSDALRPVFAAIHIAHQYANGWTPGGPCGPQPRPVGRQPRPVGLQPRPGAHGSHSGGAQRADTDLAEPVDSVVPGKCAKDEP